RLKHEAAWCSTFSCLRTSQTRDSAGFQFGRRERVFFAVWLLHVFHNCPWTCGEVDVLLLARARVCVLTGFGFPFCRSHCVYVGASAHELLKTPRQPTTGFALLGAQQVGAVPDFRQLYVLLEKNCTKSAK
ncbi:hypothetical protein T265_12806, partial [Opisthorchis viverrini]